MATIIFSTSRSISHKTLKGDPTPTLQAQEDELTGIALGMKDAGSGMLEIVSEWAPDPALELDQVERAHIIRVLEAVKWNKKGSTTSISYTVGAETNPDEHEKSDCPKHTTESVLSGSVTGGTGAAATAIPSGSPVALSAA